MLLIKTDIRQSKVHGIGLFAAQYIPKGTVTWQYHPGYDPTYSENDLQIMPATAREQLLKYLYWDKDLNLYILCSDDQRFINHDSVSPNIISTPNQDVAARDIFPGEELLCDYDGYDETFLTRVGLPHLSKFSLEEFGSLPKIPAYAQLGHIPNHNDVRQPVPVSAKATG